MEDISYRVIRSKRKTVALQITGDNTVLVRCPLYMPQEAVQRFVADKHAWIMKHLNTPAPKVPMLTDQQLLALKTQAAQVIGERVKYYAARIGVTYGRITIRAQRTLWGSCSAKGNLSFNCLLMLAPDAVLDYVVVHELCHRKELNHSQHFWEEVARVLPDHKECRRWLKENGNALVGRLKTKRCSR